MSLSRFSRLSKSGILSYTSLLPLGSIHSPLLSTLMYNPSITTPSSSSSSNASFSTLSTTASSTTSIRIAKQAANGQSRINVSPYPLKAIAGYINGQWVKAKSGKTVPVYNPADGELLEKVPDMNRNDTNDAIQAAKQAFPAWAGKNSFERSAILRRIVTLMLTNIDALAILLTAETGKPYEEAKGEIKYSADFLNGTRKKPNDRTVKYYHPLETIDV
jgi:delta 1-pyrroline-5-carboxylate dehydrogenase